MATKSLRDPKRRPTHPGAILREDVLPALGMAQKEFAERLGVSRLTVSELLRLKSMANHKSMANQWGQTRLIFDRV